jgi:hypothetical protein
VILRGARLSPQASPSAVSISESAGRVAALERRQVIRAACAVQCIWPAALTGRAQDAAQASVRQMLQPEGKHDAASRVRAWVPQAVAMSGQVSCLPTQL